MISKRSFLIGLIAAPVIIRAGILMPIKVIEPVKLFTLADYENLMNKMVENWQRKIADTIIYGSNPSNNWGLKLFTRGDDIKTQGITFQMVCK